MHRKNDLGRDPIPALIFRLAIPTMLAQFVNVLYSIVDRMFIGHIPGVGDLALAGVGVCAPIVTLLSSFSLLVGQGGTPLMAMKLGHGDRESAQAILSNCLRLLLAFALGLSLLFFLLRRRFLWWFGASPDTFPYALEYLTIYVAGTAFALLSAGLNSFLIAQGRSGRGMVTVILGAGLNIALDPVFIFALDLGVAGAAWATILSQAASALFALVSLRSPALPARLTWGTFSPRLCRNVLALGFSPFLTYALDSVLLILFNTMLQRWGGPGEGDILLTCATIVQSYALLLMQPMDGISLGCQGLVSFNYGAGDFPRVRAALKGIYLLSVGFAAAMLVITGLVSPAFVRLFSQSTDILTRSVTYIRIYTAGAIFMAIQWVSVDQAIALGQVHLALFCSLFRKGALLAAILLLPRLFPADSLFWTQPVCDCVGSCLSLTLFLLLFPRLLTSRTSPVDSGVSHPL